MSAVASIVRRERVRDLLNVLAYDEDRELFVMEDGIGFAFLTQPLAGADEAVSQSLNIILNTSYPADSLVQIGLFANPDIQQQIADIRWLRRTLEDPMLKETIEARARMFEAGTTKSLLPPQQPLFVRDIQGFVTVKVPTSSTIPTDLEVKVANDLRLTVAEGLKTVGLRPATMHARDWLRLMRVILNAGENASWRDMHGAIEIQEDRLLRDQVTDWDTDLRADASGIWLGEHRRVVTLAPKHFPPAVYFGHAARYVGDVMTGTRGLKEPFLLVANLHFPDVPDRKSSLDKKRQFTNQQAYGPLLKMVPRLATKKGDFDVLFKAFEEGDRPVGLYLGLVLLCGSEEHATASVSKASSYFGQLGFKMLPDPFFGLPLFLTNLPFGAQVEAIEYSQRYRTMATRHAIPLLPIFGEWKGTGTAAMNFIGRQGQLMNVSIYDSGSNYNLVIAAQSGSGKSVLANEMIASYRSMGGWVRVIDVGKSYINTCEQLGGQFVTFEQDSKICLNPFQNVKDYKEEADMLVGLLSAMAAPTVPLTDYQTANLKEVVGRLWEDMGTDMTVDDVARKLLQDDDQRVKDIGEQLYAFTSAGEYGQYFVGKNNLAFDNPLIVLELEELKGREHLQQIVLLTLIYSIQNEMYLGDRGRPKIVMIDEAWDLLTKGDVAKFIETGYRRVRKYNGAMVTITQSVTDMYQSNTGRAIVENSANMYLLGQKSTAINAIKKEGRLPIGDGGYDLLKTVRTVPGQFSEIFFLTDYGAGIGRLIIDPIRRLLYSTNPQDIAAIKARTAEGKSVREAVEAILRERGEHVE